MKPTESSEEGHGRIGEGGVQSGGLAVAPVLEPATRHPATRRGELGDDVREAPVLRVSGVVAAPAAGGELEEAHTTVDAGPARRFQESQALSGRIRHAMDRTLPLGTPAPDPALFAAARQNGALHSRTMLLGGRYLAELGAAPEPPTRRAEPPISHDVVTPRAPDLPPTQRMPPGYAGVTPAAPQAAASRFLSEAAQRFGAEATQRFSAEAAQGHGAEATERTVVSEPAPQEGALRASFVRPVGLPTAPPPRRRRTIPPGEGLAFDGFPPSEPAAPVAPSSREDADHEAFALDRPRGSSFPPGHAAEASARAAAFGATTALSNGSPRRSGPGAFERSEPMPFVRIPDARNPRASALSNSVILPPPPQPHDYELSSSPSVAPPPLALAATARAASSPPPAAAAVLPTTPPAARPRASLLDLPSVGGNPLAGYEAPRETLWQRSLIVFVVALAVVGLFALGAIAFGFLGKTGW